MVQDPSASSALSAQAQHELDQLADPEDRRPDRHTPGVLVVLASSVATENAAIITFALLAIAFVTLTSPVSGHAIARSARDRDHRREVE